MDCYRNLTNMKSNCLKGCNGLFAVQRGENSLENDDFENILTNYESYKRGFHDKIIYPLHLNGECFSDIIHKYLINAFRIQSEVKSSSCPDLF